MQTLLPGDKETQAAQTELATPQAIVGTPGYRLKYIRYQLKSVYGVVAIKS